jgi:hypothetical protein
MTTQADQAPEWEIVVGHYGKILVLRYANKEQAENTFELLSTAVAEWSDYKNDRNPTIRVTDDIGVHVFATSETKSVSFVEIETVLRANFAFKKRCEDAETAAESEA